MTDEEIIKALKCCSKSPRLCVNCPADEKCLDDVYFIEKQSLDLINRQKAEIERLQSNRDVWQTGYVSIEAKAWELSRQLNTAKAEAIKDFAERLTDKAELVRVNAFRSKWMISDEDIDNLVKQMTESEGEENGK